MEELNSCWARGGGGFAWIWLVKCRKVHKETLVLVHSIGFTEVKQSTFLSNKPKDSDRKGTAASCGAADVSLRCRLNTTGPPTSTISPMHPCESSTLRLWASSLCAFHVFVTWMKTRWSRWQFGRLTEVKKAAGEGGESRDISAESETDVRRETTALLQMRKIRLV